MSSLNILVEGAIDEAVALKIVAHCGHTVVQTFPRHGFTYIRDNIKRYNQSAKVLPCLTLVDFMDTGLKCPSNVIEDWLPDRELTMIFRVVVREIESWLIADHTNIAAFLGIPITRIPAAPETLPDPKQALINLARRSRSRQIQESLVPEQNSSARVGRLYVASMIDFVTNHWDISNAAQYAPSLMKCITRLQELP